MYMTIGNSTYKYDKIDSTGMDGEYMDNNINKSNAISVDQKSEEKTAPEKKSSTKCYVI